MYYPIIFNPIYKQTIWGGGKLSKLFCRTLPFNNVGESWDISCRQNEMGVVKNGDFSGLPFSTLIAKDPVGYLGSALSDAKEFPLLVKLIDACDNLSVQVHPPGEKSEIWVVLQADDGAQLNVGLVPGTNRDTFASAVLSHEVEKYLNFISVKAGDVINIPAGIVHAIGAGVVLAEIQQNSDTTYRVYDYGRLDTSGTPRKLHTAEALDSIDFGAESDLLLGQISDVQGGKIIFYCQTKYYALYEYVVDTYIDERSDSNRFSIFTCLDNGCNISTNGSSTLISAGDSVFIPAALGEFSIIGKCRLLKTFVP